MPPQPPVRLAGLLLVTSLVPACVALVMNDVIVPPYVVRGHTGHLRCDYSAQDEQIYSVKWYKNSREFYRYKPGSLQPIITFPVDGFVVNTAQSNEHDLYLNQVDLDAAGSYRCEVTSGAPFFWTVQKAKDVQVVDLPDAVPSIRGHLPSYRVGEVMKLNCSSYRSYPPVKLHWYVNEEPVSWTSVESWTNPEPFSMTTTFSRMTHTVSPEDFNDGVMRVRCTASMNGTDYWESQEISASRIGNVLPKSERSQISNASARTRPRLSLLQTLQIMFAVLAMLLA
ncbi:uncharacterized protein LOC122383742 isoform X2 [Amphibalanus amphitrite]|uniref:uncharacterized protein LOC122383742 isoform X2 n=1 Tax=Amphibalanus amphitrite TaxID=1232801 RepID=UPI001C91E62C|nr:uncharacterized protein LOC122383742 isoform X2 [Amphibalanus amphitrite]